MFLIIFSVFRPFWVDKPLAVVLYTFLVGCLCIQNEKNLLHKGEIWTVPPFYLQMCLTRLSSEWHNHFCQGFHITKTDLWNRCSTSWKVKRESSTALKAQGHPWSYPLHFAEKFLFVILKWAFFVSPLVLFSWVWLTGSRRAHLERKAKKIKTLTHIHKSWFNYFLTHFRVFQPPQNLPQNLLSLWLPENFWALFLFLDTFCVTQISKGGGAVGRCFTLLPLIVGTGEEK